MVITINISGLNAPTKRHRLPEWIQKQNPYICCLQENHFRSRETQTESEGMEKLFHVNGNQRKVWVAILISDKMDFKIKTVTRDKNITLQNHHRINSRRIYNNFKYIFTQYMSISIYKANANSHKSRN